MGVWLVMPFEGLRAAGGRRVGAGRGGLRLAATQTRI